jgi:pyruvate-ferredoxin/flavodoxin oxidoreductase
MTSRESSSRTLTQQQLRPICQKKRSIWQNRRSEPGLYGRYKEDWNRSPGMKTNSVLAPTEAPTVQFSTIDGNEAAACVAYRLSETIAIYPITPSSPMAEFCDEWSAHGRRNLWDTVPRLIEMQSEAGVAGAVHGMAQLGSLSTTFTASQGLLLMIPNMYKIAGELLPFCMHVTARTVATHALSIFGDHSDVMACRQTGFAMLCSNSVQEAHDFAAIAHAATLKTRIPFLHFFDGFRTSHEIGKIKMLRDADLQSLVDEETIAAFRRHGLTPDRPSIRGTAQNPDVFFQCREACNQFYSDTPETVQGLMDRFAEITGRKYKLFDYCGHPEAERVIVVMGSAADIAEETADWLNAHGEKVGVLKVRLFRPWSGKDFIEALPPSVTDIAVLDRTKEPGAAGEPLYQDVLTALHENNNQTFASWEVEPRLIGGRYGLSSKEFNPAMAKAVFDELKRNASKNHFTVGIIDDVTKTSLTVDPEFEIEPDDVFRAVFFGLGADGTVGANKNSIKIIGEGTDNFAQGYFVYDSKKSGAVTISHLRFGPRPIRSSYLIKRANFVACHQWQFLDKLDVLEYAGRGAVLLLNSTYPASDVWDQLSAEVQQQIIENELKCYVIDANRVAREAGMGQRTNTIMQTCFFAISGVLPREEAITQIKKSIQKTYAKKGDAVVQKNFAAVDQTLAALNEMPVHTTRSRRHSPPAVSDDAPEFIKRVTGLMLAGKGDLLPVSAFPVDGAWPSGTTRWEKRAIALEVPVWDPELCIQCNKCVFICPHAAIRARFYPANELNGAPDTFKSIGFRSKDKGQKYTIQVSPEDCTGCTLCAVICPAKDKAKPDHKALDMHAMAPLREQEQENFTFFSKLTVPDRMKLTPELKSIQFAEPLIEYSGACAGCGETPYIKLLTQMFGDRLFIANATGCSSIYGGNLPTTPYTMNCEGRGPAWSNSLFEDNAEYGFGQRFALDKHTEIAAELLQQLAPQIGDEFVAAILKADQSSEAGIAEQRKRIAALKEKIAGLESPSAKRLLLGADFLVKKSVWILGGDGWAFDIGFGGLDHVIATNPDVNILVLNTEVYSNTGGQQSKATPIGAVAKFAAGGKQTGRKDLGAIAMTYGTAYVASVAMGAKDSHAVKVFEEAESFSGTSLIIAYAHCIAHGYDLKHGLEQQKLAVDSAYWPLFRFDPRRAATGEPLLKLDSPSPKIPVADYLKRETRFSVLEASDPERYRDLHERAQEEVNKRFAIYERIAAATATVK